jgi:hypothetical protein
MNRATDSRLFSRVCESSHLCLGQFSGLASNDSPRTLLCMYVSFLTHALSAPPVWIPASYGLCSDRLCYGRG